MEVFEFSLRKSLADTIVQKRLKNIMDTLTFNVYNYGCTGKTPEMAKKRTDAHAHMRVHARLHKCIYAREFQVISMILT